MEVKPALFLQAGAFLLSLLFFRFLSAAISLLFDSYGVGFNLRLSFPTDIGRLTASARNMKSLATYNLQLKTYNFLLTTHHSPLQPPPVFFHHLLLAGAFPVH